MAPAREHRGILTVSWRTTKVAPGVASHWWTVGRLAAGGRSDCWNRGSSRAKRSGPCSSFGRVLCLAMRRLQPRPAQWHRNPQTALETSSRTQGSLCMLRTRQASTRRLRLGKSRSCGRQAAAPTPPSLRRDFLPNTCTGPGHGLDAHCGMLALPRSVICVEGAALGIRSRRQDVF